MKRCSMCILPETAKGVNFDGSGRCLFCREYKEFVPKGAAKLKEEINMGIKESVVNMVIG